MTSNFEPEKFSPEELLGPLNAVERRFAPTALFTAGKRSVLECGARVAIVGSREASPQGLARARKLARLVIARGGVVVSGLAKGIDAAAHRAAMDCGGKTIAVIGTSLSNFYPAENRDLQIAIMRDHLCVSQFPGTYPTTPKNFPMRNRTMALLADATVIVEAGDKSGSISQGWEALRLGRSLYISNSLFENPTLTWPKELLAYGAKVLASDSVEDFLEDLPPRMPNDGINESSF